MSRISRRVTNLALYDARLNPPGVNGYSHPVSEEETTHIHDLTAKSRLNHVNPTDSQYERYQRLRTSMLCRSIEDNSLPQKPSGTIHPGKVFARLDASRRLRDTEHTETKDLLDREALHVLAVIENTPKERLTSYPSFRNGAIEMGFSAVAALPDYLRGDAVKVIREQLGKEPARVLNECLATEDYGRGQELLRQVLDVSESSETEPFQMPCGGKMGDQDGPEGPPENSTPDGGVPPNQPPGEEFKSERGEGDVTMEVFKYPMPVQSTSELRKRGFEIGRTGIDLSARRLVQGAMGVRKDIFRRRRRPTRPDGGTILIDASGSMEFDDEDIQLLLDEAPLATVAFYCGHHNNQGWLSIIAENGKKVDHVPPRFGGNNSVDYLAMQWMFRTQKPPYFMVTDCEWTGPHTPKAEYLFEERTEYTSGPDKLHHLGRDAREAVNQMIEWKERRDAALPA